MTVRESLDKALANYAAATGHAVERPRAVLFDMDGVLYDSMPNHAKAWKKMCDDNGIEAVENEFFGFEGRTGASTINVLFRRQFGFGADEETCRRLYAVKSSYFKAMGDPEIMPGAPSAVEATVNGSAEAVLVTGSGQASVLERLERDYHGAFRLRVTAHDVVHGKPDPEPYLKGLSKAGTEAWQAVAVDNAPLGVESAHRAGVFTIGVNTGPIPEGVLTEAGADIEVKSMLECAEILSCLLYNK